MFRQLNFRVLLCLFVSVVAGAGVASGYTVEHALLWQGTAGSYIDLNPSGWSSGAHATSGGQQVGWGYSAATDYKNHALLWWGTAESYVDLNPSGFDSSHALGVSDGKQVGVGVGGRTKRNNHALLWSGTAGSYVDLNPSWLTGSTATAISGSQQVGSGYDPINTGGASHALVWSGTAESCVDLHSFLPAEYYSSQARGIDSSGNIVGSADMPGGGGRHAVMWVNSGGEYQAVILHPSGFQSSWALGISGGQQVGVGTGSATGYRNHAILWSGTAESYVDLNPAGCILSWAVGVSGGKQVGSAMFPNTMGYYDEHALIWSGTAENYVDLNPVSSAESIAVAISGNQQVGDGYFWVDDTTQPPIVIAPPSLPPKAKAPPTPSGVVAVLANPSSGSENILLEAQFFSLEEYPAPPHGQYDWSIVSGAHKVKFLGFPGDYTRPRIAVKPTAASTSRNDVKIKVKFTSWTAGVPSCEAYFYMTVAKPTSLSVVEGYPTLPEVFYNDQGRVVGYLVDYAFQVCDQFNEPIPVAWMQVKERMDVLCRSHRIIFTSPFETYWTNGGGIWEEQLGTPRLLIKPIPENFLMKVDQDIYVEGWLVDTRCQTYYYDHVTSEHGSCTGGCD